MNYFKLFSLIWGIVMIILRSMIHMFPERWNKFELNIAYTEKQPKWIWKVALLSVIVVGFTWYKELTTEIPYSLFLSILVTITLLKTSQVLFNYSKFRDFVKKALLEDRKIIVKINISTTILGVILILLSIFVY